MSRIIAVGETTYDIVFRGAMPSGAVVGGSVLNTSVSLGRLGHNVVFVSRMGNDHVGNMSIDFLKANKICCDHIVRFDGNSRLALAFMDEYNNASYEFYKAEKSPTLLFPVLTDGDLILFGSTNAIKDEGRNNLLLFLNQAHDQGLLSVYDPNIRECNPIEMIEIRKKVKENFHLSKLVKGSIEDFNKLYQTHDADAVFNEISKYGVEVLVVTSGSGPVRLRTKNITASYPTIPINPISTIGAGDNFSAGLIHGLAKLKDFGVGLNEVGVGQWDEIINLAISFSTEVCLSNDNYISEGFAREVLGE